MFIIDVRMFVVDPKRADDDQKRFVFVFVMFVNDLLHVVDEQNIVVIDSNMSLIESRRFISRAFFPLKMRNGLILDQKSAKKGQHASVQHEKWPVQNEKRSVQNGKCNIQSGIFIFSAVFLVFAFFVARGGTEGKGDRG